MDDESLPSMPGAFEPQPSPPQPSTTTKTPKRKFIGRRAAQTSTEQLDAPPNSVLEESTALTSRPQRRTARALNQIPDTILNDPALLEATKLLPPNYDFELPKTIHRIRALQATRVALQMPEGLLMFATTISDILTSLCPGLETLIMGDVTYGACCVDDYTARALNCDLLVHYAHSCLIPVSKSLIETLYIFVAISIDTKHLVATVTRNIPPGKTVAMVSTIQFAPTLHTVKPALEAEGIRVLIPSVAPLSKGEILGCTAPKLDARTEQADLILYLGDGRFHLEAAMIANRDVPAYRYDPYSRRLTREEYGHEEMLSSRASAISTARRAKRWGLILGGLGRQGNSHTLTLIERHLQRKGVPWVNLLLSEIFPGKLSLFEDVECWVQVACPRLSIDWGHAFERPLLTPWEALVVLQEDENGGQAGKWDEKSDYPMDYYANRGLGRVTEKWARGEVEVKV